MREFATNEKYTCECGTPFTFKSIRSSLQVCVKCGSIHQRRESKLPNIRGFGITESDTAQPIGSICVIDGHSFEVLGFALCVASEYKFWWYTLRHQAQGDPYVLIEMPWGNYVFQWNYTNSDFRKIGKVELDEIVTIESKQFRAKAFFEVIEAVMQGELLWPENKVNGKWVLLSYSNGYHGLLIEITREKVITLVDPIPNKIQWKNSSTHSRHTITCPTCNTSAELHRAALTIRYGCSQCHSTYDLRHGTLNKLGQWENTFRPILKIGGQAKLLDNTYTVLGLVVRELPAFDVNWKEYQLISPEGHHCVLVEMNGHWTLCLVDNNIAHVNIEHNLRHSILHDQLEYALFSRDYVDIAYTEGESLFKWDEGSLYVDYIAPPVGLTFERHSTYRLDYRNSYIAVKEVKESVELARPIPPTYGVGILSEPVIQGKRGHFKYAFIVVFLLALAQSAWDVCTSSIQQIDMLAVYPKAIGAPAPGDQTGEWGGQKIDSSQAISKSFTVDEHCNLELKINAPVSNSYATTEVMLLNEDTGEGEIFYKDVEYYSGVDSDGTWSEGSNQGSFYISSLKPGRYHLEVSAEISAPVKEQVFVKVFKDVPITSNNVIFFLLLILIFGGLKLWHYTREVSRFRTSEYSPYSNE
jgi:ribosomal protein L37AE/L43A